MSAMASQATSVSSICSTFCSGADQRKHQSSVSLVFVRAIHRFSVVSTHKEPASHAENVSIWWRHHVRIGHWALQHIRDLNTVIAVLDRLIFNMSPYPDRKVHGANMELTWVLSGPDRPHVGPMNLAIRVYMEICFILEQSTGSTSTDQGLILLTKGCGITPMSSVLYLS